VFAAQSRNAAHRVLDGGAGGRAIKARDPAYGANGDGRVMEPAEAEERVVREVRRHQRLTVAVSGGIDSMTLAVLAHRTLGDRARMVHAVSPAVPEIATRRVERYARSEGWALSLVDAGEFADAHYRANPVNRCYFCKTNLYGRLAHLSDGGPIASGANLDDLGDYRPGLLAAAEHEVVHPFVAAGIDKAAIRALARTLGLDDIADLPAQPCLSSRVETGIAIEAADLLFIDRVEVALRAILGAQATVRCRITHAGAVVEIGDGAEADANVAAMVARLCAAEGRPFAGVRPYRRGAAFLHERPAATNADPVLS